jgi:tRNA threonylcarbamoyladenosine biosynthesis protein TsaB
MVLLAIETVTRRGSLALLTGAGCDARAGGSERTHVERLPGDALALLADHRLSLADVDRFVVVTGPGSFTGLRVGIAAVQGFALVAGRQVAPVSTLEAIAEGWRVAAHDRRLAPGTVVTACLDGQRGDIFFAAWSLSAGQPIEQAAVMIPPSVGAADELARLPGITSSVLVGLGMERHADALASHELRVEAGPVNLAEVAVMMAARRPELDVAPHALRPIYIRRPDAVLARERAGLTPR